MNSPRFAFTLLETEKFKIILIASFHAGLIEYKSIAALQTYMYFGDCVKFVLLGDRHVIVGSWEKAQQIICM